ncbi:AAA domain-containing protein [archaeon]|nr:AAA domain-containing protein [archaeon]
MSNVKKHYFLTREHNLVPVDILSKTNFSRKVKVLEGENIDKVISVHPEGVAWGTMYPRIFETNTKPKELFVFKGRALISAFDLKAKDIPAVPTSEEYCFQPFIRDVIDSIHAGDNVLLTGGTGVGKTTHIVQLASRIKQPLLRINFNGETRMSDLIGKMSVVNSETHWVDGVLPYAMRNGYWILFDELDFADPAVLSLLHPILEKNPSLTLKENKGEIIKPHPLFRVFATANSIGAMSEKSGSYGGTNTMNEAFLDRWQVLMVDNLPAKEEIKVVRFEAPGLNATVAKKMVAFANMARNQDFGDANLMYGGDNFSTRKIISWAKKTALHRNPIIGAQKSWLDKMPQSDQDSMMRILMTHFGSRKRTSKGIKRLVGGSKFGKNKIKSTSTISINSTMTKPLRGRPPKFKSGVIA